MARVVAQDEIGRLWPTLDDRARAGVADAEATVSYVTNIHGATTTVTAIRQSYKRVIGSTTVRLLS